jgi:uncharacterized protein (TIGR02757 family)
MKTRKKSKSEYQKILQDLKDHYSHSGFLESDPISLVHRYNNNSDREIVGFIVAMYSYGNVAAIKNFLEKLLGTLTNEPFRYLKYNFKPNDLKGKIGVYRFQKENDTIEFLKVISGIIQETAENENALEKYFLYHFPNFNAGILHFQEFITKKLQFQSYGLKFLLGQGIKNSPHKRYNMFLRWMVGNGYPDFGIYKNIPEEFILLPLDTHIQRIGKVLGLTEIKNPGINMAVSITEKLSEICGEPAIRYDFALSRIGILRRCRAEYVVDICNSCELRTICKFYSKNVPEPMMDLS